MVHRKFLWKAAAVLMSYSLAAGSAAPVVHYDLNEGAGTVVRNRAGAAGKGRFRGPVAWAPALDGSGILLDGATNSVFCGPMPELDEEKGMTLLVWFKSTHPLGLRTVASAENPESGEGWRFGIDNNRLFSVLPPNEASSGWSDGLWHLGALVIRGREVREYMDGELVRSTSLEKPVRLNAGAELAIGSLSGRELGGFHGVIDDVKIYNVVLEADRIRQEFRRLVKAPQNNPELEFRRGMILRTLAPAAAQREQLSGRLSEKYRALASRLAAVPPAARGAELEQSTRQLDSLAAEARTLRNELDKERLRRLGKTSVRTSFWGNRTAEVRLPLVWGATALDNIFSDRLLPDGEPVNRIRLDACRNEYEPGQFVISSLDYRGPVRLKLNALAHETDPAAKLTELTANFVKEIYASQNTVGFYRNPKSPLLRPAPATFPDMLSNDDTTMLEPGRSQPVWLTVRVPAGTKPGLYRGRVEVQTMFGVQPLEVEMRVYDVALPEVPIFRLGTWGSARLLANLAGFAEQPGFRDPRYWTLFEKVLRNMKEHRAYNFGDPPLWEIRNNIRITDDGKGGVEIDYSTFDRFPEMLDKVYGKGNWRVMSADIPLDAPTKGWMRRSGMRPPPDAGRSCTTISPAISTARCSAPAPWARSSTTSAARVSTSGHGRGRGIRGAIRIRMRSSTDTGRGKGIWSTSIPIQPRSPVRCAGSSCGRRPRISTHSNCMKSSAATRAGIPDGSAGTWSILKPIHSVSWKFGANFSPISKNWPPAGRIERHAFTPAFRKKTPGSGRDPMRPVSRLVWLSPLWTLSGRNSAAGQRSGLCIRLPPSLSERPIYSAKFRNLPGIDADHAVYEGDKKTFF